MREKARQSKDDHWKLRIPQRAWRADPPAFVPIYRKLSLEHRVPILMLANQFRRKTSLLLHSQMKPK